MNDEIAAKRNMAMLEGWVTTAVVCVVRGAVASLPQFDPQLVIIVCCKVLGALVGTIFHGDLASVLMRRKQCREAFLQALADAPPPPMNPAGPPGGSTLPPPFDQRN